jgi:hypothetical protein
MNGVPHPASALSQFVTMQGTANAVADGFFDKYGAAAVGKMIHDEHSGLHYIPTVGMIHDIEVAKTHVWEDGRVEQVFGS